MMIRFFSAIFFLSNAFFVFSQEEAEAVILDQNYDRCEDHEFGGWKTISLQFKEGGKINLLSDDYVIKPQFANSIAYEAELERISNSEASVMGKLDARAKMYDNTEAIVEGYYVFEDGSITIKLADDEMLNTNELTCRVSGRYLQCGALNFVLAKDDVIMDSDVLNVINVAHWGLTYQQEPRDRWILKIESGNRVLENGDDFLLESLYHPGQYLGHGRDGKLGLFPMDEMGINYNFRFYDTYGQGPIDALEDLKLKPSYFFGDYSYVIGIDQETDNARIDKKFATSENLWYVEGAMCDIVDELASKP